MTSDPLRHDERVVLFLKMEKNIWIFIPSIGNLTRVFSLALLTFVLLLSLLL